MLRIGRGDLRGSLYYIFLRTWPFFEKMEEGFFRPAAGRAKLRYLVTSTGINLLVLWFSPRTRTNAREGPDWLVTTRTLAPAHPGTSRYIEIGLLAIHLGEKATKKRAFY